MKKIVYIFLALLIVVAVYVIVISQSNPRVCFEDNCFSVEIADDDAERSKGLMFREKLDSDEGMFFIFEESGVYPFWMKNTPISLDILWLDSDRKVVSIAKNTTPYSTDIINPGIEAIYVLEISGGVSDEYHISLGSYATIP